MTIILAGHETTAVALAWTFYLLSEHPTVLDELEAEVDGVLNGRLPTIDDIPNLTYTTMVLEESMRLYPPAYAIARWGNEEDEVGGYYVPKNAVITMSPYITHRHPDFWQDPERFDPQRFTPERKAERPRFAYLQHRPTVSSVADAGYGRCPGAAHHPAPKRQIDDGADPKAMNRM